MNGPENPAYKNLDFQVSLNRFLYTADSNLNSERARDDGFSPIMPLNLPFFYYVFTSVRLCVRVSKNL